MGKKAKKIAKKNGKLYLVGYEVPKEDDVKCLVILAQKIGMTYYVSEGCVTVCGTVREFEAFEDAAIVRREQAPPPQIEDNPDVHIPKRVNLFCMTINEFCKEHRVPRSTVETWIRNGKIEALTGPNGHYAIRCDTPLPEGYSKRRKRGKKED